MRGRVLAVDLGSRRIGIALSDPARKMALPYAVLHRSTDERDAGAIAEMGRAEGVEEIVVGLPLRMDGTRGEAAAVVEGFATKLRETGTRVRLWDERLTTAEAEKRLSERGLRGRRRRQVVDKVAAAVILQSYLDRPRR